MFCQIVRFWCFYKTWMYIKRGQLNITKVSGITRNTLVITWYFDDHINIVRYFIRFIHLNCSKFTIRFPLTSIQVLVYVKWPNLKYYIILISKKTFNVITTLFFYYPFIEMYHCVHIENIVQHGDPDQFCIHKPMWTKVWEWPTYLSYEKSIFIRQF